MYKLTIVFTTNHADTLGNACRLEMVDFLTKHYNSTIITNQIEFITKRFPNESVLSINIKKRKNIPILSEFQYYKRLAEEINNIFSDGVFLFNEDSPCAIWINSPVFQYIHQYGERTIHKNHSFIYFVKKAISQLHHLYALKGFKRSQINFVVSTFLIDMFKQYGINNMVHIPHALDINKFQSPELKNEHAQLRKLKDEGFFIVSYTGWVSENRGFELMLSSIKEAFILNNKVALILAGANNEFSERIETFKKENHMEGIIINYGIIDASLIPGILNYSDVCLSFLEDVPAYRVSPPQKVIEYFASGKPVISNKNKPHEWLVKHEENGFIVNYNRNDVAAVIIKLSQDSALLKKMSQNALKEAYKYDLNYIYGKMVEKINTVLNEYKN